MLAIKLIFGLHPYVLQAINDSSFSYNNYKLKYFIK